MRVIELPNQHEFVYMNTDEVAEYLGISPSTVVNWRRNGTGPKFKRLGRHMVYLVSDIREFLVADAA